MFIHIPDSFGAMESRDIWHIRETGYLKADVDPTMTSLNYRVPFKTWPIIVTLLNIIIFDMY